jgi:hypothetical protein
MRADSRTLEPWGIRRISSDCCRYIKYFTFSLFVPERISLILLNKITLQMQSIYSLLYTARRDTPHTLHLEEISSEHKYQDRRWQAYCVQNLTGCEFVLEAAQCHIISISYQPNFMPVNFTYFGILIFPMRKMPYLCVHWGFGREVGSVLACWTYIPSFYETPSGWHLGAETCKRFTLVMNCILLRTFLGRYIASKNMHGTRNIKFSDVN